ncbi:probable E3 SUMO-protein ligase RNF212 [Colossoma macropomum]|uniref:probable E3 SUMO-protein ligase RNF212 n=1 Tax=Colossoma macropomum TaxID=42526 RepID=UPI0018644E97|nr:probable E3 SUMO-protein ligase RNF212 [Colossoma macropomum]
MSSWICCNSCFKSPGPDRQLAVTNCGHIICNVCFQKGKEGECLICKAKCQLSPLSDKSSSEVKALFSDINIIAAKYLSEINKVFQFQARHQKRLLNHYQQKSEKMKETVIKMQEEMQQMSKKITEQNAYISKLEITLQHQSSRLASQSNRDVHASANFKPALSSGVKIPYSSPVSLSHHLSTSSLTENMEVDSRGFSRKPEISGSVSRLCVISPPQDGRIGTVPHRAASQSSMGSHSVRSATVSREFSSSLKEPMLSSSNSALYRRESPWESPVFKLAPAYKYPSTSSLGPPP